MEPGEIACPHCQGPVPATTETATGQVCPRCRRQFRAELFPALFRPTAVGRAGEPLTEAVQAACFFHAGRRAVVACDACGRFLCGLCDLPLAGRHLCPLCLEKPGVAALPTAPRQAASHVLYDNLALALAGLPLLMVWPTLLTAPATLVVVWRYWGRVVSPVPRWSRLRFSLAAVLAGLEIAAWITVGVVWWR